MHQRYQTRGKKISRAAMLVLQINPQGFVSDAKVFLLLSSRKLTDGVPENQKYRWKHLKVLIEGIRFLFALVYFPDTIEISKTSHPSLPT